MLGTKENGPGQGAIERTMQPLKTAPAHYADTLARSQPTFFPNALATPKQVHDGWLWIVAKCPLCGRRHVHGAGDGDMPGLLGHRVSHCSAHAGGPNGYYLVEAA